MAVEAPGLSIGFLKVPSTAFSTKQYTAVTAQSCEGFITTPSDSGAILGVMQDAPTVTGEAVNIMYAGASKMQFNASIAAGANWIVGTDGKAHSTGSAATGSAVYGPVLENPGTTAGDIGTVMLNSVGPTTV